MIKTAQSKKPSDPALTKLKFVDVDPDRCIGCGICELVCSYERGGKKNFNPLRSRIKIMRLYPSLNVALACRLCEKAPCVRACPRDALRQSIEDGIIIIDGEKCDGCGWCIKACDYGAITIDPEKRVVMVCDLCKGRKGIGVFPGRQIVGPACIEWCPEEALSLTTRRSLAQKSRGKTVASLYVSDEEKES